MKILIEVTLVVIVILSSQPIVCQNWSENNQCMITFNEN